MYYIQVITCVSPPTDLWFLTTFKGCLEGKVTFYVIISVLRQKPVSCSDFSCLLPFQYAMFLSLVFLAELVAGISGFVFRHEVGGNVLSLHLAAPPWAGKT